MAAVRQYRADGVTRINPDNGRTGKHAALAVAENAATQMAKLGGLFGLVAGRRTRAVVYADRRRRQPVRRITQDGKRSRLIALRKP